MSESEQVIDLDNNNVRLTKWKKEPSIRELKADLQEATSIHQEQVGQIDRYLDNLNVEGSAKVNAPKGRSRIVPKLIRKQAEWRYAALTEPFLTTEDLFDVEPVTWEDKQGAVQNQILLNYQFRRAINKTKFIDEYVRTGVDEGTIICRVGWDFIEEEVEEEVPQVEFVVDPTYAELHQELAEMKAANPGEYYAEVPEELQEAHDLTLETGDPIRPKITGMVKEMVSKTVVNQPTIDICDYRNVIIDPTCQGDISKASFVIYSFESSLSELEKDGKYTNLDKINLSNSTPLSEPDHGSDTSSGFSFADEARKKIVVYEYWGYRDIDGSGVVKPIVASWVGDTLIRMEDNPYPDQEIPFVVIQYLPKRRSIYGEPDGALLEDNQKIMGAVTRGMIDILGRSANGQMGMRKDMLDAVNKRRFRQGLDYEFNANVDPRQGVNMHTFPEIPQSAQFMLQSQNMEAESLTGVKAYSQGVSGTSLGDVAASVRGALDAASKREMGILRRLSDGMIQIARKIVAMNAVFLDEKEVVRVTNGEYVEIRRDELAGQYDLKLSISTAEEDEKKASELAFMLQTLGPNEDPNLRKIILSEIATLRKMPDLAHRIETFQPQPDPIQQEIQRLELLKLQKEIEEIDSKIIENRANAQLDSAKASNLQSDTDLKNLDYVEQESGVKQERDLQKQAAQAEAQGKTKILEHQLKQQEEHSNKLREYLMKNRE
ncbi:hypothetical protein [uncultured Marinobacter sp.]|uniref:portal protein n=1 Tax=uncultured Marinobacter sp. TaxID=187379 RepID=UPI002598DFB5|nr:hypothetical protein [uncultured Marinobacter sp.]